MMKKYLLIILTLIFGSTSAQHIPDFRQFLFNQYLFNPAQVGSSGRTEISLVHRQQWLNFADAPSGDAITLQVPFKNRVSLGLSYNSQDVVLLTSSVSRATFGYKLPLGNNHSLRFGLSAGVHVNRLQLDDVDYSNDPLISRAAGTQLYASGNFGLLYSWMNLQIGFAFPEIIGVNKVNNPGYINQFRNQFYSLKYTINLRKRWMIKPYFLYRLTSDSHDFWEAAFVFDWHEKLWFGGSYRQYSGLGFLSGVKVYNAIAFSYSYELQPADKAFINTNSHELHLSLLISNWVKRKPDLNQAEESHKE